MRYIVGIDEVGRGSLAGPVVVAAVRMPGRWKIANRKLGTLRDSKKLTAKQRELWFEYLKNHSKVSHAAARIYPRRIERMNISQAANLAAWHAFERLAISYNLKPKTRHVVLDGGLYLRNRKWQVINGKWAKTIIKGDEKYTAIMAASIMAKVYRDRLMTRLAKKYPQYGFEVHKGYGTEAHRAAIRKHGPSPAHRLTFVRKYLRIRGVRF